MWKNKEEEWRMEKDWRRNWHKRIEKNTKWQEMNVRIRRQRYEEDIVDKCKNELK